jgi:hypothetical protein
MPSVASPIDAGEPVVQKELEERALLPGSNGRTDRW